MDIGMNSTIRSINLPKNEHGTPTPLRYPGGKSAIAGLMTKVVRNSANFDRGIKTYVEPYAGGAGAAVSLLLSGTVDTIVINDLDKAVYSFWDSVKYRPEKLIGLIQGSEINMDQWYKQKEIYTIQETKSAQDRLNLAFAFFFLNRTNRSGILQAGVIGGKEQTGTYKIDARFKKDILIAKIAAIAKHRKSIVIKNNDGIAVFKEYKNRTDTLVYLDPPYVQQGKNLYLNFFNEDAHRLLAKESACTDENANWIITYDDDSLVRELYSSGNLYQYRLRYTAQEKRHANELLICSNAVDPVILEN